MPCDICGGEKYELEPHETWEHTEDWVNLADARYTGEVVFMQSALIFDALDMMGISPTLNEKVKTHVDRSIIQAIINVLVGEDIDENAQELADILKDILIANPERKLNEDIN